MSKRERTGGAAKKAVALQYGEGDMAPVIVASGMGYMAEKIVETAADNGVPIYEDNSLATVLTQLELGQEIPESLYQAIVEIYVYFLHFEPELDQAKKSRYTCCWTVKVRHWPGAYWKPRRTDLFSKFISWMEKRMRSHSMRLSSWWEWRAVDWPYNVSCFGSGERGFL